jgi:hypothetical protein
MKFKSRRILCISGLVCLHILLFAQTAYSQDSTKVDVEHAKKLGFILGANYSNLGFDSKPYFLDSAGTIGRSDFKNAGGVSAGICYYFNIGNHFFIRPAVEANIMAPKIYFDTEIDYRATSEVFPVCIETPLSFIYSFSGIEKKQGAKQLPELMCAVRPVFSLSAFADLRPNMKSKNLNVDFGLGYPVRINKLTMRIEAFYSHGINNLIGENKEDLRSASVTLIERSYTGLRLLIN